MRNIIKNKKDNNLVCVSIDGTHNYFTSITKAGKFIGLAACSVTWAITHDSSLKTVDGRDVKIFIIDGSEIKYKLINNDI